MPSSPTFDNDSADICLKRYPDPSFLKMACSGSELMKPKICREKTMLPKARCTGKRDESRGVEKFMLCHYYGTIEEVDMPFHGLWLLALAWNHLYRNNKIHICRRLRSWLLLISFGKLDLSIYKAERKWLLTWGMVEFWFLQCRNWLGLDYTTTTIVVTMLLFMMK